MQINALRVVSLGLGFLGSIWSSRCLGPDKLGVSGMVIGTITPLVFLINLNQTAHIVRLYRGYSSEIEKADLVSIISTYKITVTLAMILIGIPLVLFSPFPPVWNLALLAAFPYFFMIVNAADWLLQCEDKFPAITMAMAIQATITTSLYFLFFHPGMPAGSDLVVIDIGLGVAFAWAWYTGLNRRKIRLFDWQKLSLVGPIIYEGRWLIATGFAIYIYTNSEIPLVGWLYSLKELGIYRTSLVLCAGVQGFTSYIPMLLYARMLEWQRAGPQVLWQHQKKILGYFALFTVGLSLAAFALAPLGYSIIYGPSFQKGAYPFAILLTAKLVSVMNGIMGWGMVAQKKERSLFKIMAGVAVFSLSSNVIFIPLFGAYAASTVNLLSESLMTLLMLHVTSRLLRPQAEPAA